MGNSICHSLIPGLNGKKFTTCYGQFEICGIAEKRKYEDDEKQHQNYFFD